jgi:hypothetical protein
VVGFLAGTALAEGGFVFKRRKHISLVALGLLIGPVCSTEPERGCSADSGLEAEYQVVKCVQDNRCVGQGPHPSCPASPDGAAGLCSLYGGGFPVTRSACGQDVLVFWSGGVVGFFCLYDARGSLTGTLSGTDSPSYCGRFARWTWGTEIPEACLRPKDANLCAAPSGG